MCPANGCVWKRVSELCHEGGAGFLTSTVEALKAWPTLLERIGHLGVPASVPKTRQAVAHQ